MLNKKEAIQYVINHPTGDVSELREQIGADRLVEFEYLGYIKNGISGGSETYGATSTVQQDYQSFYKKPGVLSFIPSVLFGGIAKLFS